MSTRREFLGQSGTVAAAASTGWFFASEGTADEQPKASADKMAVAVIGPGGMGMAHTNQLAGNKAVRVAYVCDVDEQRAAKAAEAVTKGSGVAPKVVKDMR